MLYLKPNGQFGNIFTIVSIIIHINHTYFVKKLFNDIKYQFEYKYRNKNDTVTDFLKYL
jgi:hypothetical protein